MRARFDKVWEEFKNMVTILDTVPSDVGTWRKVAVPPGQTFYPEMPAREEAKVRFMSFEKDVHILFKKDEPFISCITPEGDNGPIIHTTVGDVALIGAGTIFRLVQSGGNFEFAIDDEGAGEAEFHLFDYEYIPPPKC